MQYPVSDTKDIKVILGGAKFAREYIQSDRNTRLTYLLQDVNKSIEWGYISDEYTNISHGLLWGIETYCVNATCTWWLKSLSVAEVLGLLQELRENCKTQLEVIFYLNKIQIEETGYDKEMHTIYKRVKTSKKAA